MATETIIELGADFYRDPHSVYRELRADGGVHRVRFANGMVGWLVTDYDTVSKCWSIRRYARMPSPMQATRRARPQARAESAPC